MSSPALPWPLLLGAVAVGFGIAAALAFSWWRHQQQLADQLHDERETARALRELADGWVWRSDAAQRLVEVRPPAGGGSGVDPVAAAVGQGAGDVFRALDGSALAPLLASRAPIDALEVRVGDSADAPRGALWARPWRDARGRFAGHVGALRTETAAREDHAAAEAMRAEVESFSYTVSHDLRAPLRVVEGFSRIVKEDYGRQLDRIGHDHLDRVMSAAARMNGMIDALLELSKLSTQPVSRQRVDLSQLAGWVVDELRRQYPAREVEVRIEPGLLVQGDPTLLRLVLDNLLGNAWKYSAKRADAQIGFGCTAADTYAVRDNGAGFDMRFADRLFGVFQRLHSVNDFQGTGVGLASVRRIVRRHGGEVWAEAEVGRGATFYFTLPAAR